MKQSTKDEAKGKFHQVKGRVKEKVGRATNNSNLEAEGQDEKIGGKVQKKIGRFRRTETDYWRRPCSPGRMFGKIAESKFRFPIQSKG